MHRGAKYKAICRLRLFYKFVHNIIAETFSGLQAGTAADASCDRLGSQLNDLCLNAVILKCCRYFFQCCIGTSLYMSASVYQ